MRQNSGGKEEECENSSNGDFSEGRQDDVPAWKTIGARAGCQPIRPLLSIRVHSLPFVSFRMEATCVIRPMGPQPVVVFPPGIISKV